MEGVILSSWDYIMGPQIERLWLVSENPTMKSTEVPVSILRDFNVSKHNKQSDLNNISCQCDLKTYSFMCGQLLLGEMDASETLDENASRTYISDYKILTSVVFRMKTWMYAGTVKAVNNVILCIGLLYKRSAFNFILQNQFMIDFHLRKLADSLQNSKPPYDSALTDMSVTIMDLAPLLKSQYPSNLDHSQNYVLSSFLDYSVSNILPQAIVSHLQTSGYTIVLGGSEFKIKQIINVLSLFNDKEELCSSLLLNVKPLKSRVSSFSIQGVIKNTEKDCEHFLEEAYNEALSLTVVDTDHCKVWQTYPFHESYDKNRVFSSVTETGCSVPNLLKDLSFANKNDANCHNVIKNFTRLLMMKAVAVVKAVSHFRSIKRILSKQELMTLFSINMLVDLQIILGCAEKVKPGIRCSVL